MLSVKNLFSDLKCFEKYRIVAGKMGLANIVSKVGILDYEIDELISQNFKRGEFVISTLVIIKDDIEKLYSLVSKMISVGISGLAIKNVYFDEIPQNVIKLANENEFPIIIFSDVYFEDIICEFREYTKQCLENDLMASKIDIILHQNIDNIIIKKIAYEINRNFKENNIVLFCKKKNKNPMITLEDIQKQKNIKIISYKDGYLIIYTFNNLSYEEAISCIIRKLERSGIIDNYRVGISNKYNKLEEIKYSINESLHSYKYAKTYKKNIVYFKKIGINKIILPLLDNEWVLKYYEEIIDVLIEYDKKHDTYLLETIISYVKNNGNIKSTSKELFQHENTIRYRIEKMHKILSENCNKESFYEEMVVAVKIYILINDDL